MRRSGLLFVLLLALGLIPACGERAAPPKTPTAFMAWVREADETGDQEALRSRLAKWPSGAQDFRTDAATQVALTWRMRLALSAGDVEGAIRDAELLDDRFGGGLTPEGAALPPELLFAGIVDSVLEDAAGAAVRDDAWLAALDRIEPLTEDEASMARLATVRAWLTLEAAKDLGLDLPPHDGPRVVAVVDHFALGEAVLPSVLARWARVHATRGLEVVLVPPHENDLRVGIRRVRAERTEIRAAFEARAREGNLVPRPVMPKRAPLRDMLAALNRDVAVFVVDRKGRIVARVTGRSTVDPRGLEEAVQRVTTR